MRSRYVTKYRPVPILLGIFVASGFLLTLAWAKLQDLQYSSDGFHIYSVIRNSMAGVPFYEGPIFGNILAVHSYFTLIFAIPFVWLINGPYALLVYAIFLWGLSLLLLTARYNAISGYSFWLFPLIATITLLPLFDPRLLFMCLGYDVYLFQPDFLIVPVITSLITAFAFNRPRQFHASAFLLFLTKEEYLIYLPVYAALTFILHRRRIAMTMICTVCFAILCLALLFLKKGIQAGNVALFTGAEQPIGRMASAALTGFATGKILDLFAQEMLRYFPYLVFIPFTALMLRNGRLAVLSISAFCIITARSILTIDCSVKMHSGPDTGVKHSP